MNFVNSVAMNTTSCFVACADKAASRCAQVCSVSRFALRKDTTLLVSFFVAVLCAILALSLTLISLLGLIALLLICNYFLRPDYGIPLFLYPLRPMA